MNLVRISILSLALAFSAESALAGKLTLSALSSYLNDLKTAEAEFTQINDDGTIVTGQMYLRRPGRARFEYKPPDETLVMAGGGQVAVFDAKSNLPPDQFPLRRTPLNLILAPNVDLSRAEMVVGHTSDENTTSVIAQDPKNPEYGQIELVFTADPIQLRQWIISDGTGQKTTVILGELKTGVSIRPILFDMNAEIEKRGLN